MNGVTLGPPRVLQLTLSLNPGGTERLVIDLATRLGAVGPTAVCCLDDSGAWASMLTERGIPVWPLNRQPGFQPGLGHRIARLAARCGATVVHCHHYSSLVYGQIAAHWNPGLRVVFTEHGRSSDAPVTLKRKAANRILTRLPGRLYTVSANLRDHLVAEGFLPSRLGVIYNGIDPGPVPADADRQRARRLLGLSADACVIGSVARFDPVKDLTTLLRAFAAARSRLPQLTLVLIGDGDSRAALEVEAQRLGIAPYVHFAGARNDVRQLMPAFDIYANSSIFEGVSLTILEAMSASVPVAATRVGGTPEVVVDGTTGLLVPARDVEALATALARLAGWSQRRQVGAAGRARVERMFTIDRMARDYFSAYAFDRSARAAFCQESSVTP